MSYLSKQQAKQLLDKALSSGRLCSVTWVMKCGTLTTRTLRLWSKKGITYYPHVEANPCGHIDTLYTALDVDKAKRLGDNKAWVNVSLTNVLSVKQKGLLESIFG